VNALKHKTAIGHLLNTDKIKKQEHKIKIPSNKPVNDFSLLDAKK